MSAFTASGTVTTDWPSLIQSKCLYENYNTGYVFPQAIPINMTLTGDFPTGFPVGVNIEILGPTDNTLLPGMTFPVQSAPRDMLAVYPAGCLRKNKKCLATHEGNGYASAVNATVTSAAAQTFLFYVFLPTLFPGWFDVNYRVTFGFLDSYFYPNGTQVNSTLTGTVTWPAPIDFTVRKRTINEPCDTLCDGPPNNLVTPFDPANPSGVTSYFTNSAGINTNTAPVLGNLDFIMPRDIGIIQRLDPSYVSTIALSSVSEDPLNPTPLTIAYANSDDFPRAPHSENLKLIFNVAVSGGSFVMATSFDNTTYQFVQAQIGVLDSSPFPMANTFAEPTSQFMASSGAFDCANGEGSPAVRESTEPVNFVMLKRGTSTYMTIKAWSVAGDLTLTKYVRLDYNYPDPDPSLTMFNLNNYQDGRPNFPITSLTPALSLTTTKVEPFVLSVGRVAAGPDTSFDVTADCYFSVSDPNTITNTITGSSSIVDGIAWFNIPVYVPIFAFANGPVNKIVVKVAAQGAINYVLASTLVRNVTAFTANYTFTVYNGTTQNIVAELSPGDDRLHFNPYSSLQRVDLKPIDASGKPSFPLLSWTLTYANNFVNTNFGPANPIFYLNGDMNNPIVTTNSDTLLPYTTYPLQQNYLVIKVRETNFTVLLNISSSLHSVAWEVSYDGSNFVPVDGLAPFDFTTLSTTPVAVNQSAQALRLVTSFDTSVISLDYSFTSPGSLAPTTGTISNNGSTAISLPGQGNSYLFTLKAGDQGSYDYAISQSPYRNFNQFNTLTSTVGDFAPAFAAATTDYNLTVPFGTTNVSLSASIDPSASVTASAAILNMNNISDATSVNTYLFRYANGLVEVMGLNPSAATAPYVLAFALSVQSENPALPATLYTISIFVAPRVLSTDSSLSALATYPTDVASFAPTTLSYSVSLPYPETLFKVSGSVNSTSASGVGVVSELFNVTSSTVISLISNNTVTVSNVGAWETANISAATATTPDLAVRVTVRVVAEDNSGTNYVVNVQLGPAPVVPSSSSTGNNGGSNTTSSSSTGDAGNTTSSSSTGNAGNTTSSSSSSSSTGNGGSNTTASSSSSTGNGGSNTTTSSSTGTSSGSGTVVTSSSSTGTSSGSGTVVTSSSSTGNGGSNGTTSSSSTGTCVPGQAGCNSAYARAAVGMASPFAILMAIMAILLLA